MHDIAGLVAAAILGLWIAYLVPHRLRYRQQLLESRAEDRFSGALRVLVVADARRDARSAEARVECGPDSAKRSGLLSPARGVPVGGRPAVTEGRGGVVERPYVTGDKLTAEDARRAARVRAQRAAALSRRAAAARRRAALTGVLTVAAVVAWVVVGLSSVAVVAAVIPTVLLAGVVALSRRSAVQARAADAAWERQQERAARPAHVRPVRVTGRAQRPSDSHTEAIAQVGPQAPTGSVVTHGPERAGAPTAPVAGTGDASSATPADATPVDAASATPATPATPASATPADAADSPASDRSSTSDEDASEGVPAPDDAPAPSAQWSPVPVPRPTYTTKATAPRREPAPLVVDEPAQAAVPTADGGSEAATGTATTSPIDLDAVLARRRAAGE